MDGEADSRFSQFCNRSEKSIVKVSSVWDDIYWKISFMYFGCKGWGVYLATLGLTRLRNVEGK
jgi:hypothetical protein